MTNLNAQQFTLFPRHLADATPADVRNRRVPVGGQMELPLPQDVEKLPYRGMHGGRLGRDPEDRLKAGEHPVDVYHGGTYPMLMTGPEVRHQFQPLDGDRKPSHPTWHETYVPSQVAPWTGPHVVDDNRIRRFHAGERIPGHREGNARWSNETDDELYNRKLDEAHGDPADWTMPGAGVADAIHERGFDLAHPVSLSTGTDPRYGAYGGRGSQGRYQVLGGHHRVAVMSEELPRQFMSVQWAPDIGSAKASPTY